ncbi:MAG: peptidylprolyl isomerase [Deltaproteobacteria bacterium]|nr:peptidylprolyl isomerase [Deltaproteobacteria bacterium]
MKKRLLLLSLIAILAGCHPKTEEPALAEVGREKITLADWRLVEENSPVTKESLENLIEEKLLIREARRKGFDVSSAELEGKLKEIRRGSDDKLEQKLASLKIPLSLWKERQREKLILAKWLEQEIRPQTKPTEEEVSRFFRAHYRDFFEPEQVRARQITVSSKEKAEKIREIIKKGENFVTLAQQHSESPDGDEGGDLGFFSRGSYPKVFEDTCFRMKIGEVSPVVSSEYGFHIFKVIEKRAARFLTEGEAKNIIVERLLEEKENRLIEQTIKQLKATTAIVIHEERFQN